MSTAVEAAKVEDLLLNITDEIHVKATPEVTFEALLEQLGSGFHNMEGQSLMMKLEAWPGGRWYRDLGDGNGHLWGHVQSIKRAALLEFHGPLMMSFGVVSNVQYRLSQEPGGTLIKFHHFAVGAIPEENRKGLNTGWKTIHERVKESAERK